MNTKLIRAAFTCLFFFTAQNGMAALTDTEKIDKALEVVERLCLSGSSNSIRLETRGAARLLRLSPQADLSIVFEEEEYRGNPNYLNEKLRLIADEKTRQCLQRRMDYILNQIFSDSGNNIPLPNSNSFQAPGYYPLDGNLDSTNSSQCVSIIPRKSVELTVVHFGASGQLRFDLQNQNGFVLPYTQRSNGRIRYSLVRGNYQFCTSLIGSEAAFFDLIFSLDYNSAFEVFN